MRTMSPGETRSSAAVTSPESTIRVPAAGSQLSVNVVLATGSPAVLSTSRPGHAKA